MNNILNLFKMQNPKSKFHHEYSVFVHSGDIHGGYDVHSGEIDGGRYFALLKPEKDGKWFVISFN